MNFSKRADKGSGKVDVRVMKRTGKARLRFYNVAPDHLENITTALDIVRKESGTEHDTVALDLICTYFLATFRRDARVKCSKGEVLASLEQLEFDFS